MYRSQRGEHGKNVCRQRQIRQAQKHHQKHLATARPELDNTSPPVFKHLITRPKKDLMAEERNKEIALENGVLLQKMTKMLHRENQVLGAASPRTCANNHRKAFKAHIAHERARIESENLALLSRLRAKKPVYSTQKMQQEFSKSREYLNRICQNPGGTVTHRQWPKSPRAPEVRSGSQTARLPPMASSPRMVMPPRAPDTPNTGATRPNRHKTQQAQPVALQGPPGVTVGALPAMDHDELVMLLSIQQPSEMLEKVLAAVLMMVSPYAPHEVDCSWSALQDWVAVIGGPANFLHNLQSFNILTVRSHNAIACHEFLQQTSFSEQALSRISHILARLYRWVTRAVEVRLAVSVKAVARMRKLRVGLDIEDAELRSATAQAVKEAFELVELPADATAQEIMEGLEASESGVVLTSLPKEPGSVQALHEADALPQLVLTGTGGAAGNISFAAAEGSIVPEAHAVPMGAVEDLEHSMTKLIRLGSATGEWPDRRIAVLAPPSCGRKLLCEGLAAQYGLRRVHLLPHMMAADLLDEAGQALKNGTMASDGFVFDKMTEMGWDGAGQGRGTLLDGIPRTVAQAEMLEANSCSPQVVIMLQPDSDKPRKQLQVPDKLHQARMAAHHEHYTQLVQHYQAHKGVTVISLPISSSSPLTTALGSLMVLLETRLPLLAVPYPITLQAAALPAARAEPPHRLYKSRPEMVDCVAGKVLTQALWDKLSAVITPLGTTLDRAIQSGAAHTELQWGESEGHQLEHKLVGLVCCDEHGPAKMEPLYRAVLQELHGCTEHTALPEMQPQRLAGLPSLSSKHVHSVCVSGRRNLAGLPLLPSMSVSEMRQTQQLLALSMNDLGTNYNGSYTPLSKDRDTHLEAVTRLSSDVLLHLRSSSLDRQLITRAELDRGSPLGRGVWVSGDQESLVWLNHEDHLQLFGFECSTNVQSAFARFVSLECALEECVETRGGAWMHSTQYGFLTTSPAHWGTTLHVSFECTLPRLCESDELEQLCRDNNLEDCTPSLLELSPTDEETGRLVLCNTKVFGLSEVAVVQSVVAGVAALIAKEEKLQASYDPEVAARNRQKRKEEAAAREAEKAAAEEAERIAAEKAEKAAQEQAAAEQAAQEAAERAEAEKAAAERAAERRAAAEKAAADKAEADKVAKAEADKAEADKAEADKAEADKAEADKAEADKAEADKAEADSASEEKAAEGAAEEKTAEETDNAPEEKAAEEAAEEKAAEEAAPEEKTAEEGAEQTDKAPEEKAAEEKTAGEAEKAPEEKTAET